MRAEKQPELAALLDVATETVSRWETGADPIRRQTQLAVLLFLEHTLEDGQPVPLASENEGTTLANSGSSVAGARFIQ